VIRSRISVLLAEDHGVMRDGLRAILDGQRDIRVVAVVGDGDAAVQEAARHLPTVAILGMALAGLNGIETARILADKSPEVAVLILALHSSPMAVRRALEAGAIGYLGKDSGGNEVLQAVRSVAEGKRYLGQGLAEGILAAGRQPPAQGEPPVESLTATERSILKLVADGLSNPKVAEKLGLSRRTVETYRLRLMRKLGIGDLASLVKYAIRHGLATLD
jgi:DNA-binding NarL/FixJ family response regulator